ncbi:hypothetical protein [Streptomyces sp. BRA346]|uniref:hypothetical protein n=1 Tax=Streptomyces sp. BRA346 TaxID=2878199 RepID=UPI004064301B
MIRDRDGTFLVEALHGTVRAQQVMATASPSAAGPASPPPTRPRTARSGAVLKREMAKIFPQLSQARIDYVWGGSVGFSYDRIPHAGQAGACTTRWAPVATVSRWPRKWAAPWPR